MTWEWVAVLGIVVIAWTVFRVTQMWQQVAYYRYATDDTKNAIWLTSQNQEGE
jgi:hypothetical protein